MRNAECTPLTPEEEKELFGAFPRYLGEEDVSGLDQQPVLVGADLHRPLMGAQAVKIPVFPHGQQLCPLAAVGTLADTLVLDPEEIRTDRLVHEKSLHAAGADTPPDVLSLCAEKDILWKEFPGQRLLLVTEVPGKCSEQLLLLFLRQGRTLRVFHTAV